MKKLLTFALLFFCNPLLTNSLHAQSLSTEGKEFYAGFLNIIPNPPNTLRFVISSRTGATGTISMPTNGGFVPLNFSVAAGATYQSPDISAAFTAGTREQAEDKGFYIRSNTNDISVTAINLSPNRTEASLVLPLTALGKITEYLVNTTQKGSNNGSLSEFMVVATENNTVLEITPKATTTLGRQANVPFNVTLQRGQVVQYQAVEDLTGTKIKSANNNCKSFAVFAGANTITLSCMGATFPLTGSSQHVYEQQFPTHTWGREYIVTPYSGLSGVWYKVLAQEDNTQVTLSTQTAGGILVTPITLSAGTARLFSTLAPVCVKADKPVNVVQMSQNSACNFPSNADPSLLTLNAINQTTSRATFNTMELGSNQGQHFVNVIMKTADIALLRMNNRTTDNGNIPLRNYFSPVAACNEYATASIPIGTGGRSGIITSTLEAANGFSAFAYGYSQVDMYAYAVGASFENLLVNYTHKTDSVLCNKTTLSFAGVGTNASSFTWDFGDNSPVSLGTNVSHTYTQSGTYKVTMTVVLFGNTGCSSTTAVTKEINVVVNKPFPVLAAIQGNRSPLTVCGVADSLFAVLVDSAKYQWNLNGLPIKNATNPKLIISQSGIYTLTVAKGLCSSNTSQPVIATFLNVIAKIQGDSLQTFCDLGRLRAEVKDSTLYTYEWRRNNQLLAEKTASIAVNQAGIYTLTLQQGICKHTSKPTEVKVNLTPLQVCDSTILEAQQVAGASYLWTRNKATIGSNSPTLRTKLSGVYTLTVTLNGCSKVSKPLDLTVTPTPTAKINEKNPLYFCTKATLTTQKVDSASYIWFRNGAVLLDAPNKPELLTTVAGTYRLLVRVRNCEKLSDTIRLIPNALRAIILQKDGVSFCEKGNLQADSLNNFGEINYEWSFNNKVIGNKPTQNITESGKYSLRVFQETCEAVATVEAVVHKFPIDLQIKASKLSFCPDSAVTLQATGTNLSPSATFQWQYNNVNLPQTSQAITVNKAGNYKAIVTIANQCSKIISLDIRNFAPIALTLKQEAKPFEINQLAVFPNPTTGLLTFEVGKELGITLSIADEANWKNAVWFFDTTQLVEQNNKGNFVVQQLGNYRATATDLNGCPQNSATMEIKAQVLPTFTLSLLTMLGQVVINSQQTFKVGDKVTLDLSGLAAGMYWLRVQNEKGEKSMKVAKIQP
jgi:PKD repeat protein